LIAQTPLEDRGSSRLLHLDKVSGEVRDRTFRDVVNLLNPGDLLVWNDTRVTARRLFGKKPTGASVEALLLRETGAGKYEALLRPGKRLKPGAIIEFDGGLRALVVRELDEPIKEIEFQGTGILTQRLQEIGLVPLPPYIHSQIANPERYQTVYNKVGGSAAAPTAGLHFTEQIIADLVAKGVETASVTLDVSLDTFRPVMVENLQDHRMHGEVCRMPVETADKISRAKGRVIAVGTTSARTLEAFAIGKRRVETGEKSTSIFIQPGYDWQIVDGMFTNFHMPRTTMLMMISAMAGRQNIMRAYAHAIQHRYRFLSFGDSMLIL
jgi:S-adenosylmethionine:tRNA ribosyltransferase-isomerase